MSSFHFCLAAAKNLSSFQLLPASLMTDLLQLFLCLPLFLLPWGFHSRAAFDISPSSFLNVWPIHLNFLFLISRFMWSRKSRGIPLLPLSAARPVQSLSVCTRVHFTYLTQTHDDPRSVLHDRRTEIPDSVHGTQYMSNITTTFLQHEILRKN